MITEELFTLQVSEEGNYDFCVSAVHHIDEEDCESNFKCMNIPIKSICEPVRALSSQVDENVLNLSWSAPELEAEVLYYNVYHNDVFVVAVETESFSEEVSFGFHIYAVEAVYINECISDLVSINVRVLSPPANFTAITQQEEIELSWEYEDGPYQFNIYKDGDQIASGIRDKKYIDTEVFTDISYCYYVKATLKNLVSIASDEACAIIIGIKEFKNNLKVYPNPATGEIRVTSDELQVTSVEIFDVYGRKVSSHTAYRTPHITIDVSHLAAGNYVFAVAFSDGSTENVKVVIK
jgi:hypothetical protein